MRQVLYILPKQNFFLEGKRGRVTHAVGIVEGLIANGIRVNVLSSERASEHLPSDDRVSIAEIDYNGESIISKMYWEGLLRRRISEMLENNPSIDTIFIRYAVSNTFSFIPLIRKFKDRTWMLEINSLAYHQLSQLPKSLRALILRIEQLILNTFDGMYVVSSTLKHDIISQGFDLSEESISITPNAGGRPLWPMSPNDSESGKMRFLYLGVFQEYYDLDTVLKAFGCLQKDYPSAELHFHGDGPQRDALVKGSSNLSNVYFHGRYKIIDALVDNEVIAESDVLILPYSPGEIEKIHSPIKMYEYMSLGLPILALPVGQVGHVLEDNKTALFYDSGNQKMLCSKMKQIIENDDLKSYIKKNIRSSYNKKHTWDTRMKKLIEHILELKNL